MKVMKKKLEKYKVEQLGELPIKREDGTMRILVSQMGGCTSGESREIKISATKDLIRRYNINLCTFMELNFNWTKVNSSANLASWFHEEEREIRSVTAQITTLYGYEIQQDSTRPVRTPSHCGEVGRCRQDDALLRKSLSRLATRYGYKAL